MGKEYERTLEETPTWAVAVVCFVLLAISITIEHIIHVIGKWFKKKHNYALYESLEKVKGELMLLGFISLLLTVFQGPISTTCISEKVAATWHPCASPKAKTKPGKESDTNARKVLEFSDPTPRRFLATKGYDKCKKNEVALMSAYGIHQLHIFIFVLAIFHILQCIITLALGRTKMRKWKMWEVESKTVEYQSHNDQTRFRFTRDTTFGRRHLNTWSQSSFSLWIVSFFRQFFVSVTKVDYLALRHGFILAHLTPESEAKFDFHEYIQRSLEEDFKVVVGISPILWFFAVLILLTNTHGWYPNLWLPFIPLIIILLVGAKLQMIITKMGLKIQERGEVVRGAPVVEPRDELFWFRSPNFLLNLIHFVLFQNAFQLAFFAWTTYEFTIRSCFHKTTVDTVLRLTMGILIQVLCSYVTLPLYALVTQMGSSMKHTIFKERVAAALKEWHHTAKKRVKDSKHSFSDTPSSSMSSVQLKHKNSSLSSNTENEHWDVEGGGSPYPSNNPIEGKETQMQVLSPTSADLPLRPSEISFEQPHSDRDLG